MRASGRPLLIVPLGLKAVFMREAGGAIPFQEIREVDPTHPGHEEFEELIGGDGEPDPPQTEEPRSRPFLRLIALNGKRLEP